jgi:16S rRNA (guanine(966)-N(2))-methyltransferase RsmD
LRVISGKYKGRRLTGNKIFNARPTTDLARESLFNILNNYFFFDKIRVLDLFSGTGSISFEFISRGCKNVELVESDSKNFKFISSDIKELNIENLRSIKGDAFWYLEKCLPGYDIIFADPPYDLKGIEDLPVKVFERNLLKEDGWFILEHSKSYHFNEHPNFKEERKYGAVHFSIFMK